MPDSLNSLKKSTPFRIVRVRYNCSDNYNTSLMCSCRTMEFFPKLIRTSIEFMVCNKPLMYELGSIQRSSPWPVSCWCCANISVSHTRCSKLQKYSTDSVDILQIFWSLWGVLHLGQVKLVNCNQILVQVAN